MSNNPFLLTGKTILITGASSGIGKATAIECSKMGAKLIITGRNGERLNETFHALEGEGHKQIVCDLTNTALLETLVKDLPQIDGCVNNAGVGGKLPIAFIKKDSLQSILDINTIVPVLLTQLLVKNKKLKKGSSMVLTSSISGVYSVDIGNTMYSITKSAIDGFMKNSAVELAQKGIRVNSVNPGMVDTPINNIDSFTEEQKLKDIENYPLKRYGKPEDIAYGIIYLLSDASSWVTGTSLKIDGGYSL
jgi:NAD(P)-dependent dehydrogenase (short-subunit alcohol dehydrogenase family)